MKKDAEIKIRLTGELKKEFKEVLPKEHGNMSVIIIGFIKNYIKLKKEGFNEII